MQHKRQFKGTKAPRFFFDRRVRQAGNTKILALGKFLPKSWSYVRIELIDRDKNSITIKIDKLLENEPNASHSTADTGNEQDA